jgi:hypothetical protein
MPIVGTDIQARLSGGSANTNPAASLGGAMSSTAITDATLQNLFPTITGPQSASGYTDYYCFYFRNNHGSLTLQSAQVWINTNTPSPGTDCSIGLDPAGIGGTATTIGSSTTAPSGVTFSQPTSGAPLSVGNVGPGQAFPLWGKRVTTAGSAAYNADSVILQIQGQTAA